MGAENKDMGIPTDLDPILVPEVGIPVVGVGYILPLITSLKL